jgi:thioester reductase-like protein
MVRPWQSSNKFFADDQSQNIDWAGEGSLPEHADWFAGADFVPKPKAIAMTGATGMIGAHFLHTILSTTNNTVHCIGIDAADAEQASTAIISTLQRWKLYEDIKPKALDRIIAYSSSLSDPKLGLSQNQISNLDKPVGAISHLDSAVSLLENYKSIRASNVDSMHFLVSLAASSV